MAYILPGSGLVGRYTQLIPGVGLYSVESDASSFVAAPGTYSALGQSVAWSLTLTLKDAFTLTESTSAGIEYQLRDILVATDSSPSIVKVLMSLADECTLTDVVKYFVLAQATDELAFTDAASGVMSVLKTAVDRVSWTESVSGISTMYPTLVDAVTLTDITSFAYGLDAVDELTLTDSTSGFLSALATVTDAMEFTDSASGTFTFVAAASDQMTFTDSAPLYVSVVLGAEDGISFVNRIPLGEDEYQMWVVNADNIGATQYTNMPFNSIATHSGVTLGLTENGLYELSGETDDSTEIDAYMRTGHLTFGSTQNKAIDRAYLYVKSDQDLYLKTISDYDGQRHAEWYKLVVDDKDVLRTRLLRTKREVWGVAWSFQVENIDGGSLDLRGVEVKPVLLRRTN